MRRLRGARVGAALLVSVLALTLLTACTATPGHQLADWLSHRAGVVSTSERAAYPELIYQGFVRAELDPHADRATLEKLVDDTNAYLRDNTIRTVTVSFGIQAFDFDLDRTALSLWEQYRDTPNVVSALVSDNQLFARALFPNAFDVYTALAVSGVAVEVHAYRSLDDVNAPGNDPNGSAVRPLVIKSAADCTVDPKVIAFARSMLDDPALHDGSFDLCTSLSAQYTPPHPIAATAISLRAQLDRVGLGAFPVLISERIGRLTDLVDLVRTVDVTPGRAAALSVLPALDAAGADVGYQFHADGSLVVDSTSTPVAGIVAAVAASPGAASLTSLSVDDGHAGVVGTNAEVVALLPAATALAGAAPDIEHVLLGTATGTLWIKNTGSITSVPDNAAITKALFDSGLWKGRDWKISYDNQKAEVKQGVTQPLQPSYVNNDDLVLQGFLDAWKALVP